MLLDSRYASSLPKDVASKLNPRTVPCNYFLGLFFCRGSRARDRATPGHVFKAAPRLYVTTLAPCFQGTTEAITALVVFSLGSSPARQRRSPGDWGAGRGGLDDCRSWVSRSVDTHSPRAPDGPVGRHMVAYGSFQCAVGMDL